ncbi:MAG: sugar ABC transporter substrate-binding protein [Christensenella sp.]|nr:sugar ABC transporter substrate-binding protein [Christensenella sp.]
MKKILVLVLCAIMTVTLFVGCTSNTAANSAVTETESAAKESAAETTGGTETKDAAVEGVSAALVEEIKSKVPDKDYSGYTIGFCGMTLNNEYHIMVANAVSQACKALGMNVEIQAGSQHQSVAEQLTIIENYISQGVDGIILVPAASDGLISALQECQKANIPVINLDTQLDDNTLTTLGTEIPFYGTDNYVGGQLVGEKVAEMYPNGCKVAILRGVQGQTNDEDRYKGFLDKAGKVDLVAEQHADWETDKGYTAVQNIIQSNPDLEVVYCENDLMGVGAYQAVDEAGLTDQIKVFSYDGITEGIQYVIDGKFVLTCAQQPIEMGKLGVINMAKIFAGETAEKYIDTGCKLVTADNAKEVMAETEQYTAEISATS